MYKIVKTDTLQKGDVFLVEYGDYDNWVKDTLQKGDVFLVEYGDYDNWVKVRYDHSEGAWVYGTLVV